MIDAPRRGCEVQVLLDSTYYNIETSDPIDNDNTVEYVNEIALAENLNLKAKLVNLAEHDFTKIHNKGMIVDDKVLISSINWNLNSVTANRETGVIIQNQEVADFFKEIFDYDWMDDTTPPFAQFSFNSSYKVNTTVTFNANTSFDNVEIVNYTWALDGQPVSWDVNFTHNFTKLGLCSLNLTASDAWENKGWVEHNINITEYAPIVMAPEDIPEGVPEDVPDDNSESDETNNTADNNAEDSDGSMAKVIAVLLLVPLFVFITVVFILRIRNR